MSINYNGEILEVYGDFFLDPMNSCFYKIIDKIKGYDICETTRYNIRTKKDEIVIFALPNRNND